MKVVETVRTISSREHDRTTLYRLVRAAGLLMVVFAFGTFGYYLLTGGEYSLLDCAFMTVITLTTVGYGEAIPINHDPVLEIFTISLIVMGMGMFLYFVSALTAFIVDGELRDLLRRRRMAAKIDRLEDHLVVCGVGNTGQYVIPEMIASSKDCVIVDTDPMAVRDLLDELSADVPFIEGDATDDDVLERAGIERAMGVVFSLGNDRDNLFATITARRINPNLRIVTRGEDPRSEQKFRMAGATSVIYTNVLGGMRMAAEAMRPEVTTFLDLMMQDHGHYRRVEELPVPDDSPLIGKHIRDIGIRKYCDALIIAVYVADEDEYYFNPGPDFVIPGNSKLIVLALLDDIDLLERIIREGEP